MPLCVKRPLANQVGDPSNKRLKTDILASPGTTWLHSFPNMRSGKGNPPKKKHPEEDGCLGDFSLHTEVGNTSFFGHFWTMQRRNLSQIPCRMAKCKKFKQGNPLEDRNSVTSISSYSGGSNRKKYDNMMLKFTYIDDLQSTWSLYRYQSLKFN